MNNLQLRKLHNFNFICSFCLFLIPFIVFFLLFLRLQSPLHSRFHNQPELIHILVLIHCCIAFFFSPLFPAFCRCCATQNFIFFHNLFRFELGFSCEWCLKPNSCFFFTIKSTTKENKSKCKSFPTNRCAKWILNWKWKIAGSRDANAHIEVLSAPTSPVEQTPLKLSANIGRNPLRGSKCKTFWFPHNFCSLNLSFFFGWLRGGSWRPLNSNLPDLRIQNFDVQSNY